MLVASIALVCVSAGEPDAAPSDAAASTVAARLSSKIRADAPTTTETASTETANDVAAAQSAMDEYLISVVNAQEDGSWTAGINEYFEGKSMQFLKQSCGLKLTAQQVRQHTLAHTHAHKKHEAPRRDRSFDSNPC